MVQGLLYCASYRNCLITLCALRRIALVLYGSVCLGIGSLVSSGAQPHASVEPVGDGADPIGKRLESEISQFKGEVSIYAKNLATGAEFSLRADERVPTASTIKVPIMVEAFAQVADGKRRWDEELVLTKENKVGGSGILSEFHDGLKLTLKDAVNLMIVVSGNAATNLVLDVVTTDAVNQRMELLGLQRTRVLRKAMGKGGRAGQG